MERFSSLPVDPRGSAGNADQARRRFDCTRRPCQHVGLQMNFVPRVRAVNGPRKLGARMLLEKAQLWNQQTIIFLHTIAWYQKWCSSRIASELDPMSILPLEGSVPARPGWPSPVRHVHDRRSPCTLLQCSLSNLNHQFAEQDLLLPGCCLSLVRTRAGFLYSSSGRSIETIPNFNSVLLPNKTTKGGSGMILKSTSRV